MRGNHKFFGNNLWKIFGFFYIIIIIINWVGPVLAIRAGPKQVQPDSIGLGRLAAQQTLFLGGLNPAQLLKWVQPGPSWLLARPTNNVNYNLSPACRTNSRSPCRSQTCKRITRKGRKDKGITQHGGSGQLVLLSTISSHKFLQEFSKTVFLEVPMESLLVEEEVWSCQTEIIAQKG